MFISSHNLVKVILLGGDHLFLVSLVS